MNKDPFLGILSLDTAFERIVGDVGNPQSYPFPVRVQVVDGADSPKIVRAHAPEQALADRFVAAAQALEAQGAIAIISTCGFLVHLQDQVARSVQIPVMLSALSLFSMVRQLHKGRIGILTASEPALADKALAAAGVERAQIAVAGMEECSAFSQAFLRSRSGQSRVLDQQSVEAYAVAQAQALQGQNPDLEAIILECGNLPPYADAIKQATGLPVYDLQRGAVFLWEAAVASSSPAQSLTQGMMAYGKALNISRAQA